MINYTACFGGCWFITITFHLLALTLQSSYIYIVTSPPPSSYQHNKNTNERLRPMRTIVLILPFAFQSLIWSVNPIGDVHHNKKLGGCWLVDNKVMLTTFTGPPPMSRGGGNVYYRYRREPCDGVISTLYDRFINKHCKIVSFNVFVKLTKSRSVCVAKSIHLLIRLIFLVWIMRGGPNRILR